MVNIILIPRLLVVFQCARPMYPSSLLGDNTIDGYATPSFGRDGAASVLNHWPQMACLMTVSVTDKGRREQIAKGAV